MYNNYSVLVLAPKFSWWEEKTKKKGPTDFIAEKKEIDLKLFAKIINNICNITYNNKNNINKISLSKTI